MLAIFVQRKVGIDTSRLCDSRCPFCEKFEEDIHLLFACRMYINGFVKGYG